MSKKYIFRKSLWSLASVTNQSFLNPPTLFKVIRRLNFFCSGHLISKHAKLNLDGIHIFPKTKTKFRHKTHFNIQRTVHHHVVFLLCVYLEYSKIILKHRGMPSTCTTNIHCSVWLFCDTGLVPPTVLSNRLFNLSNIHWITLTRHRLATHYI